MNSLYYFFHYRNIKERSKEMSKALDIEPLEEQHSDDYNYYIEHLAYHSKFMIATKLRQT